MKKIIAIVTIGATTAFLQVNAQEAQPTEKEIQEAQEEVIKEGAQPSADFEQNQYGTYPQGEDAGVLSPDRVEISKSELPQEVLNGFENSEYANMDIVAIYEVKGSEMDQLSDEPINDPDYDNTLNEEAQTDPAMNDNNQETEVEVEINPDIEEEVIVNPDEQPVIESEQNEEMIQEEAEENPNMTGANTHNDQASEAQYTEEEAMMQDNTFATDSEEVKYEIKVNDKEEEKQTTLTFSEEGELEKTSEESNM